MPRTVLPILALLLTLGACAHAPGHNAAAPTQEPGPLLAQSRQTATDAPLLLAQAQAKDEFSDGFDDGFSDGFDDGQEQQAPTVADPLRPFNEVMFHFNDTLYFAVLKPVATGYKAVVPQVARTGVKNFFHNLAFPVRFVGNVMQGKFLAAGVETSRFVGNTFFGALGLADVTKNREAVVETTDEDLGQTLGAWGMGNGFYIVWPVLGPSTLRDSVGTAGDSFLDPINYLDPWWKPISVHAGERVNSLSFRLGDYEDLKESALDPYTALRNAYIQNRAAKVEE